jgi:hypothetical protein
MPGPKIRSPRHEPTLTILSDFCFVIRVAASRDSSNTARKFTWMTFVNSSSLTSTGGPLPQSPVRDV